MEEKPRLKVLTAEEVSRDIFGGKKSAWSILEAVRKREFPCFRIGNRIFFEEEEIRKYITKQMQTSLTPDPEKPEKTKPSQPGYGGIRRIW